MMDYKDKIVFVVGGTSGINLGIAEAFAKAGATVVVASRSQEKVDAAVAVLREYGGESIGFAFDVRQYDAVEAAMAVTVARYGLIDVVISGAAGNFLAPAAKLSTNGFKTVLDIDVLGTFNVMRSAWEHIRKPGAAIVNISAAQSWLPTMDQIHVCAAKAGIDQITRTLAMEWGPVGVRINSVAPGPIAGTEGMRRLAPTLAAEQAWVQAVPLRRLGSKEDIAKAVLWLCSSEASYVTGVLLSVDGGYALGGSSAMTHAIAQVDVSAF